MATDQEIRDAGIKFLPQQKYLQSPYQFTEPVAEEKVTESFGIPNTNSFTNNGGGSYDFNSNNFNNAINNRQYNLNNPNKINQFVNKGLSFIGMQPQRSVDEMIESGEKDERSISGIPLGIGAMFARALPDKYYDQSLVDQAYTQANMGYTGPTIFGKNNIPNKDPFGRNIRNLGLFSDTDGNYIDVQKKSIEKLDNLFSTNPKYAGLKVEEDEDGNYVLKGTPNSKYYKSLEQANKMNKVNLAKYNFDKIGVDKTYKEIVDKNVKVGNDRDNYNRRVNKIATTNEDNYKDAAFDKPTPSTSSAPQRNYSQHTKSGAYGLREGGRAGYFFGGRVNYKVGGRVGFKNGGLASIL